MGCFCQEIVKAMREDDLPDQSEPEAPPSPPPADEIIPAVSDWLAAHWLPAPPWQPDPEWMETELPDPPMEPQALSVIIGMIQAQQACEATMGVDATQPDQVSKLARIVGTLNRRMRDLQWVEEEAAPWQRLATRNDQIDSVRDAIEKNVFVPPPPDEEEEPPFQPWRPLFVKLKALAPLVAVAQLLRLDFSETEAPERLADKVRAAPGQAPQIGEPAAGHARDRSDQCHRPAAGQLWRGPAQVPLGAPGSRRGTQGGGGPGTAARPTPRR